MSFDLKNIWEHPMSSLVGIGLVLTLVICALLKVCAISDVMPAVLLAVPFLLYGRKAGGGGATPMLALGVALLWLMSCQRELRPGRATTRDSVHVLERERLVTVAGGTATPPALNLDSLAAALRRTGGVYAVQDGALRAELRYWVDQYGRLRASCEAHPATVPVVDRQEQRTTAHVREVPVSQNANRGVRYQSRAARRAGVSWPVYFWTAGLFTLAGSILGFVGGRRWERGDRVRLLYARGLVPQL